MVFHLIEENFFLVPGGGFGWNVIIFGIDMSSPVYVDNKVKDILILDEGPTQKSIHSILLSLEKVLV